MRSGLGIFVLRALLICFILGNFEGISQEKFRFEYISSSNGLTSNLITGISEDQKGIYWISTANGLVSYNGFDFVHYFFAENDSTSLSHNGMNTIFIDANNKLFISNNGGLDLYNPIKDNFVRLYETDLFQPYKSYYVSVIKELQNGQILLGTDHGVLLYDYLNNTIINHQPPEGFEFVGSMYRQDDSSWLLGTRNGVIQYLPHQGIFETFKHQNVQKELEDEIITSIEEDNLGRLFIGTNRNGLYVCNTQTGSFQHYSENYTGDFHISDNMIKDIHRDKKNRIWVSSDQGMNIAYPTKDLSLPLEFDVIPTQEVDPHGMASSICTNIFEDSKGWIWVGSIFNGVSILTSGKYLFEHYKYHPNSKHSTGGKLISDFAEDRDGNIWIGIDEYGISKFDPTSKTFTNYPLNDHVKEGFISNKVVRISIDKEKNLLWGGIWGGGFFKYNIDQDKFRVYLNDPKNENSLCWNYVHQVMVDDDHVWIGTPGRGLDLYDSKNDAFTHFNIYSDVSKIYFSDQISALYKDNHGQIWVGTQVDGLFLYDPVKDSLVHNHQISKIVTHNFSRIYISQLTQDEDGNFWIATNNGLFYVDLHQNVYHHFTSNDNLVSNNLAGIQLHKNTAWVSSDNGMMKIDFKKNGKNIKAEVRNFDVKEGIQNKQFIGFGFKSSDGKLYFGGVDGFNIIDPDNINEEKEPVKSILTNLRLNNVRVQIDDGTGVLDTALNLKKTVKLNHHQNSIGVEYSALYYKAPHQVFFKYILEGFDKEWSAPVKERLANYPNLPPGNYVFRVKTSANMEEWPDNEVSVVLEIKPAWYQTLTFKSSLIGLFILILFLIYYMRVTSIKNQKRFLEKAVRDRTNELNEALRTIQEQNEEIQSQNEELSAQNAELSASRDHIEDLNQHLEKRVIERTKNLVKANEELDRFVYSASHDLSSPLKSILGLINISRIEDKNHTLTPNFEHMEKSVLRLEDVIFNLTQFSRNTGMEVLPTKISFDYILNEVLDQYCSGNTYEIKKLYDPTDSVITDFYRLKIIMANIITNAIKYKDERKGNPEIIISLEKKKKKNLLTIKDNGIGIDAKEIEHIFEMFYRASEQAHGSGLGLYIVKEMLNKIKGNITVISEIETGSTFTITFPDLK